MTLWFWLYIVTVAAALGRMLFLEYRRTRSGNSLRPTLATALMGSSPPSGDRVQQAFTSWSREVASSTVERVQPIIVEAPELPAEWPGLVTKVIEKPIHLQPAVLSPAEAPAASEPEAHEVSASVEPPANSFEMNSEPPAHDYYEILQISRSADVDTIHRVYRMMAARFHPDNTSTGDVEKFLKLRDAYYVLSDPDRKAAYDRQLAGHSSGPLPVFGQKGFVDGLTGEINRRLGVLSLLYNRRRMNEENPGISVLDLERLMSFPREYLQFTLWYLKGKGLVTVEGNSDYILTAPGVDYLEEHSAKNKLIRELLTGAPAGEACNEISASHSGKSGKMKGRRRRRRASAHRAVA